MAHRDLVVIGGSAGGLEALLRLVEGLPGDFPAAILVVLHIPTRGSGLLPKVIQRRSSLPVAFAEDGAAISFGRIVVAPPDHHLVVTSRELRVIRGPRENRHRPAVDPLFRSAAVAYGPRVIGMILSGSGSDGAIGMAAIHNQGGYLIVQRPADALFSSMPQSVLDVVSVDAQLPSRELAQHLARLVREPLPAAKEPAMSADERQEQQEISTDLIPEEYPPGSPSVFSCPDCGGVLWEQRDGALTSYRCRVGHGYSVESLLDAQQDTYEAALWAALRALEEKADLYDRMARQATERGYTSMEEQFLDRRAEIDPHIAALRKLLTG